MQLTGKCRLDRIRESGDAGVDLGRRRGEARARRARLGAGVDAAATAQGEHQCRSTR